MTTILQLILATSFLFCSFGRIIEITNNNVHLVVRSVGELLLLLNHPQCTHSQKYTDRFVNLNTTETVGLADCNKDKQLCDYLNVTQYPTLLLVSNQKVQHVNQNQFLQKNNLISRQSSQITTQHVLRLLKDEKRWVAVVLQQQKMPPIDKLSSPLEQRAVYVSNPSRLHSALTKMMGDQLGCWILLSNNGTFHRYYCGTGYKSDQLEKHINNFVNNKLERHLFTKEQNSTYIESSVLSGLLNDLGRKTSQCKLIYFHSSHCQHCDIADYELIKNLAEELPEYKQHHIQIFGLDQEEFPQGLVLKRVPELIELCEGKIRYFGQMFTIERLKKFLRKEQAARSTNTRVQDEL